MSSFLTFIDTLFLKGLLFKYRVQVITIGPEACLFKDASHIFGQGGGDSLAGQGPGALTVFGKDKPVRVQHLPVYPQAAAEYLEDNAEIIDKNAVVIDCCGTKRDICAVGFRLAREHGFLFVGGHPMAGTHFSGFKYSRATLFKGAPMVLVPPRFDDIALLERAKALLELVKSGTRAVFLSHLSLDNNLPELAYNTVCGTLADAGYDVGTDVRVTVSRRDKVSDMLVLTSEDVQAGEA